MLSQDVDAIIEEEKLGNDSAFEEPEEKKDGAEERSDNDENASSSDGNAGDKSDSSTEGGEKSGDTDSDAEDSEEKSEEQDETDDKTKEEPAKDVEKGPSASEKVEQAKTLIGQLQLTEDKIFDDKGNAKPFEDVVPAGAFIASQLNPVKVTDKDGKTHEFLLLSDVEKQFPDGFEAKNNIEQMKFERAILANEQSFENAVKTYNQAKEQYQTEVGQVSDARQTNANMAKEYSAMAKQGLVPKVEGDTTDPNNKAVKELDSILNWMEQENAKRAEKGISPVSSLYDAKMQMDAEGKKSEVEDKKNKIIEQRKSVASLTAQPVANNAKESGPKTVHNSLTPDQLAEQIIAEEGLK